MKRRLLFFMLPTLAIFLVSCKQKDLTPSWVKLESVSLQTDEVSEGANSHNITDIWVFKGNEALGVFEVGAVFPVLDEGSTSFTFHAGIKNNGIASTKVRYPFYEKYEVNLNLVKDDTTSISPTFTYKSGLQFTLMEDFEDSGIDFIPAFNTDTPFVFVFEATNPDIVEYGTKCGAVFLTSIDTFFRADTDMQIPIPSGQQSYLEIDYMNDNSISMGFKSNLTSGQQDQGLVVLLNAQDPANLKWKKIYIELSENVSAYGNQLSTEIYFLSFLDLDDTEAKIYMDNIKVVHF